jgi:hypothetical protein
MGSAVGCASHAPQEPQIPHPEPSAALDTTPRTSLARAQQLVVAANLELYDLNGIRAVATSDYDRAAVDAQMVAIRRARDQLQSQLPAHHEAADAERAERLRVASTNLERVLQAGAVAEPQAPPHPAAGSPRTRTLPNGWDYRTNPPYR